MYSFTNCHLVLITPFEQVHIRKVKLLKSPKFDLGALLALHGESSTDDKGQKVYRYTHSQTLFLPSTPWHIV